MEVVRLGLCCSDDECVCQCLAIKILDETA